jgi:hypothetical protein
MKYNAGSIVKRIFNILTIARRAFILKGKNPYGVTPQPPHTHNF